ncbi:SigE family RNA polymerase sigma factor [Actinokineospora auranticolor]|uniref:RNA polymerase sigma-70 factor (Sigma-E family) n=1 Tax=Actinokineospora auranticolor TaxID=155976 RepID=A0A2S6GZL9_9PSEU|nr:SigE family RNA polymerase sigma factor [Actinokineospora auranticolor]PPK70616.1 RNA polymerase sigma-70 factor (sigma-E family) [Actinokineospora auranticolor]
MTALADQGIGGTAATGDLADFAEFVGTAMPGLLRYGYALTGNPHDAADLVQGVLEKVGARWASVLRKDGDPMAYARRAMANAHVSRWRRTRRENLVSEVPDTVAAGARDAFENEPLWQALRTLPPRQRAVIVLRYYDGLSEVEIARALKVTAGTVKSQTSKAMATLRGVLATTWEGEGTA